MAFQDHIVGAAAIDFEDAELRLSPCYAIDALRVAGAFDRSAVKPGAGQAPVVHPVSISVFYDRDIASEGPFPGLVEADCDAGALWGVKFEFGVCELIDEVMIYEQFETRSKDWDLCLSLAGTAE